MECNKCKKTLGASGFVDVELNEEMEPVYTFCLDCWGKIKDRAEKSRKINKIFMHPINVHSDYWRG